MNMRISKIIFSIVLLSGTAITAKAQSTPVDLVRDLYKAHNAKSIVDRSRAEIGKYFDTRLTGLIMRAKRREDGIDFDILYNAQDTEIKNFSVTKAPGSSAQRAVVNVSFTNFGKRESIKFQLNFEQGRGWRVSEITYSRGMTLSGTLSKG